MKLPIYPMVILAVIIIVGGVALGRTLTTSDTATVQTNEKIALVDNVVQGGGAIESTDVSNTESGGPAKVAASPEVSAQASKPSVAPITPASGYTMAQVTEHGSDTSCWTAIDGSVYDLTTWIKEHPGGKSAILRICGKDGTNDYNSQHGGQARAERELASFRLGALIN